MDKVSRIVAAAIFASSIAAVTPALAVDTTAEDFVIGLSSNFSQGDLDVIFSKLTELKRLNFEGVMFDSDEMVSIDRLLALLEEVKAGGTSGGNVSATLLALVRAADQIRFVKGGIFMTVADLNFGTGSGNVFPAGSAG